MSETPSRTARIRAVATTDPATAERMLAALLSDLFGFTPVDLRINADQYSLNSLNGFFETADGQFFFKFHQEEGEEAMAGEYYRAGVLSQAGLPVDQPVHISALPGEQVLVYRRRHDPRFSDVLRDLDLADDVGRRRVAVDAERDLSQALLATYLAALHPVTEAEVAKEAIHRLFYERLADPRTGRFPAGRLESFYVGQRFDFPGAQLEWDEFSDLRFEINGRPYARSVGDLFRAAGERLAPARLADAGGMVAHGDAHNANVWFEKADGKARLSFFDPAFAGPAVPSLLAEVKPTFHNVFAHPFWLYDPELASSRYDASASVSGGFLRVRTDWDLTPVRRELLDVKAATLWRPLLAELKRRSMLPADWRTVIRLGLFLSPTLVMNLRAGARTHNPVSSLIGFSVAVMVGSPPLSGGADVVTGFLDSIDPDA